jgi:hypothetical protein
MKHLKTTSETRVKQNMAPSAVMVIPGWETAVASKLGSLQWGEGHDTVEEGHDAVEDGRTVGEGGRAATRAAPPCSHTHSPAR